MIEGDGFFMVQRNGNDTLYSRAGAFNFDAAGNLVTLDGDRVMGFVGGNVNNLQPVQIPELADGTVSSLEIGPDGVISVVSGGATTTPFRLALANFPNPEGLAKAGDTTFRANASSGAAVTNLGPGDAGVGTLRGGALEMSNVDLAAEFTNLIIAQRGFQATSRVITTSDQVLEELVNIKR
jgi:flagellar hook protein FlgE